MARRADQSHMTRQEIEAQRRGDPPPAPAKPKPKPAKPPARKPRGKGKKS